MSNFAVVHTETHDETKPAGSRARSLGDDDIREYKRTIRERLAVDHEFAADESGNDAIGIHKKVTMKVLTVDPATYADVGYVYLKTVSGVIELFYKDSAGTVIQISTAGKILGDNVQLTNNVYLKAKNAAGSGTVDIIKASASDKPVLPDGAEMASDAAPTTDVQITNKKYIDSKTWDHGSQVTGLTDDDHPQYVKGKATNQKIDSGTAAFTSGVDCSISFNFAFATAPVVVVSPICGADPTYPYWIKSISTTGFVVKMIPQTEGNIFQWIAIGTPA